MTPNEFEAITGLSGYECSRILKVASSKWYEWRGGIRPLPAYIEQSMKAHARLHRAGILDAVRDPGR